MQLDKNFEFEQSMMMKKKKTKPKIIIFTWHRIYLYFCHSFVYYKKNSST